MYVLGIWDGHDSGAALLKDGQIAFAANEERFTRKKLEVEFPFCAVREALAFAGIRPADVGLVAVSTSDFAKTLTRVFPGMKRRYYLIRRRKVRPTVLSRFSKTSKYVLTEIGPSRLTRSVSSWAVKKALGSLGFSDYPLVWVHHHLAHAAAAVYTSPFSKGLFLSLDGIGDGLSGMLGTFDEGGIRVLKEYGGRDSLGIFFEHVTNLLNMRELEDEGKVMALASFGYPIPDAQNPLLPLFTVDGLDIKARYHSIGLYRKLKEILFLYPSEQFAYMAQRVLEVCISELVENARRETGLADLAYAGGVASNIKVNMLLKNSPGLDHLYVFPHMGDGGLALGAAIHASRQAFGTSHVGLDDLFLGPAPTRAEIEAEIERSGVRYERLPDIEDHAAELISRGEILLWYQGRMEYGPRALGDRSILAVPSSVAVKNRLNVFLKKRVWYQPFCPSMLEEDAAEILEDYNGVNNRFMTVGYMVKPRYADRMVAVINADNSCRPQILGADEASRYGRYYPLLRRLKERTGAGVVLNTSFNKHGESIINTPREALELLLNSQFNYLVMEDYLIWKDGSPGSGRSS